MIVGILKEIKLGDNVIDGQVTYQAVAEAFGMDYTPVNEMFYNK